MILCCSFKTFFSEQDYRTIYYTMAVVFFFVIFSPIHPSLSFFTTQVLRQVWTCLCDRRSTTSCVCSVGVRKIKDFASSHTVINKITVINTYFVVQTLKQHGCMTNNLLNHNRPTYLDLPLHYTHLNLACAWCILF